MGTSQIEERPALPRTGPRSSLVAPIGVAAVVAGLVGVVWSRR